MIRRRDGEEEGRVLCWERQLGSLTPEFLGLADGLASFIASPASTCEDRLAVAARDQIAQAVVVVDRDQGVALDAERLEPRGGLMDVTEREEAASGRGAD